MPLIHLRTNSLVGELPAGLNAFDTYQVYNGLDSAITAQLLEAMRPKLNANHQHTYAREMHVQALCLEMSTTGFPVDQFALAELLWKLEKDEAKALSRLHAFCEAVDFGPLNPNSPQQIATFFYDHLGLPAIYEFDRKTNTRKLSTDIKAMEKLRGNYPIAAPFVNAILAAKQARKMASVFKRGLEPKSGNLRCNVSPSGTETGRLSSQQNPYGRGTNAQNLTNEVRQVITAPDDFIICNIDLKTAESIAVGFLSGDAAYINACLTGDLHTAVAKLNWPTALAWTGDLASDKKLAEQPYYRHFTYRDMAKRGGHGTNYYGTARTMAQHLKLTTAIVQEFQDSYFTAFPGIPQWHLRVIAEVQQRGIITTPMRRERRFWGRPDDPATHREAIAHGPQSLVADVWNDGLCALQRFLIRERLTSDVRLLMQVHDSGVFLIRRSLAHDLIPVLQQQLEVPVDFGPLGVMIIPTDVEVGRRWCKAPKRGGTPITSQGLRGYTPGMSLEF